MSSVNQPNPNIDQTVRIYDRFYSYETDVPVLEYDAVNSFFRSQFKGDDAANNFTVALFRVAESSGVNVIDLLQTFQGKTPPEINIEICYYLNNLRSNATLLGVLTTTTPNFYTARNVRQ